MPGPLDGIRVLDLTAVVAGPIATMFLADQGADVIKVEPLGGDISRRSREPIDDAKQFSSLFISANRGKRSLALDMKSDTGRDILSKLIARSDVVVQNFRPGTMERLGFGYEQLSKAHPKLIFVSINGVGESGPYAKKRIYDPMIQAMSGLADIQAQAGTNKPQMIRTIIVDKTTAVVAAQAITAALFARERTGKGDHVRVSLLDAMVAFVWPEGMMQYTVVGRESSAGDPNDRPDLVFPTTDGFMTVGTISDAEWQGFCRAVDNAELTADERFATPSGRYMHATARINRMAELLSTRSTADWLKMLDAEDVPCAPILRRREIMDNEQIVARGLIETFDQPGVGAVRQPKPAGRFEANPAGIQGPAPGIGEHSRDILAEIGFDDAAIDLAAAGGAVRIAG